MRRLLFATALLAVSLLCASMAQEANAQMTDSALTEYIRKSMKEGKSTEQIGREVLEKGATPEQIRRLKSKYESGNDESEASESGFDKYKGVNRNKKKSSSDIEEDELEEFLDMAAEFEDAGDDGDSDNDKKGRGSKDDDREEPEIFGHDIFHSRFMTFEPNENLATPADYKLGPGDEVIIDVWGTNETSIRQTISPEGRIMISGIGPVSLSGMTIAQAEQKVRKAVARKFADIDGQDASSDISLTLGAIRTINVNVMGEVKTPGTYRLSPFATVFTALYRAGGVSEIGSLRNIQVIRDGKQTAVVDVYSYLFASKKNDDIILKEGDVLIVPASGILVNVTGKVRRPMRYELKEDETAEQLLEYAGGFTGDAVKDAITVVNKTGKERKVSTVKADRFASFTFSDRDSVSIWENSEVYANKIEIEGAVYHPGVFELGGDIATVRQLVEHAGGLLPESFKGRALITRTPDGEMYKSIPVNIGAIMDGNGTDVVLKRNDVLRVFNIREVTMRGVITVEGSVNKPGNIDFMENTSVEDVILLAGGLLDGASTAKVDVYRRVLDPAGVKTLETVSRSFELSIQDDFVVGGEGFILEPYDIVVVRNSPGYKAQGLVTLSGEVEFEGTYALENKNERLSDIIGRAGGVTDFAYVKGASLVRHKAWTENTEIAAKRLHSGASKDSLAIVADSLDTYIVGIELDKALAHPGSEFDLVLKDGDNIIVPEYDGTVVLVGAVMSENAVRFEKGKSIRYYVNHAGGFAEGAARSKVFIMSMNGNVNKGRGAKVEPGSIIYVPMKKEREKMSGAEIMSMGSTATSMATIMLYLVSLIRSL